jgi:DNA-binding response OmpR family regulator
VLAEGNSEITAIGWGRVPQAMNENILLVEDEEDLRMALRDRLRREGYVVDTAANGETGFHKATSQPFDLMIIDIVLPERSGLDLCRDIRRAGLGTLVLMLSGRRAAADLVAGFHAGADAYVTKPFDMLELSARVEALLRRVPGRESKAHNAAQIPAILTRQSEAAESRKVTRPDRYRQLNTVLRRGELDAPNTAPKNCTPVGEAVPRLRIMLDNERQTQQRYSNAVLGGIVKGVIEFLEQVFIGGRSPKRPGSKEI